MTIHPINAYLQSKQNDLVADLQTLIRIQSDAQTAEPGKPYGKGAADCLDQALELARRFGFSTRNFDYHVGTIDFGEQPKLGILCHLDTVPAGAGWTYPPFQGVLEDGRVYGRGAIDDKGPAVAVLHAMAAVKELGIPLKYGVRLLLGCNEERGSSDLAYYRQKEAFPEMVFTPDGNYPVINIEKGQLQGSFFASYEEQDALPKIVSIYGGKTINAVPATAEAVILGFSAAEVETYANQWKIGVSFTVSEQADGIHIHAEGKGAHASTPELGENALTALIALLNTMPFADSTGTQLLKQVEIQLPHGDTDGNALGIAQQDEKSGALTLAFSIFSFAQGKLNGQFDIRFPLCESVKQLEQKLKERFAVSGFDFSITQAAEPHETAEDSEFVQTLLRVYEEQTGEKGTCLAIGGGTYVHHIDGGVAFGAEFPGQEHHMHGPDEFIEVDSLLKNAALFAHAIVALCGE